MKQIVFALGFSLIMFAVIAASADKIQSFLETALPGSGLSEMFGDAIASVSQGKTEEDIVDHNLESYIGAAPDGWVKSEISAEISRKLDGGRLSANQRARRDAKTNNEAGSGGLPDELNVALNTAHEKIGRSTQNASAAYVKADKVVTVEVQFVSGGAADDARAGQSPVAKGSLLFPKTPRRYAVVKGLVFTVDDEAAEKYPYLETTATMGHQMSITVRSNASDEDTLSILGQLNIAEMNGMLVRTSKAVLARDDVVLYDNAPRELIDQLEAAGNEEAKAVVKDKYGSGLVAEFKRRVDEARARYGSTESGGGSARPAASRIECKLVNTVKRCKVFSDN
ncbi:MAG: hypothetical protein ABJ327_08900 [Litoreibacter sp.]